MGQDVNEYEDTYKHEALSEIILKMLDQYGNGELLGMDVSAVGKEFLNLIKNHLNTINVDKDSDLYNNIKEHVFNYFKKNFEEQLNVFQMLDKAHFELNKLIKSIKNAIG
jgi:hypothetical protein